MTMKNFLTFLLFALSLAAVPAGDREVLFNGSNLEAWEYQEGGWVVASDGSMTCRMEEVTLKNGKKRVKGMGYIWTKKDYSDFEISLSYKLSEGANSGVFYRTDKSNPVNAGFEIQLMDNEGFQKSHGIKDAKKLNGSFYEGKAPSSNPDKGVGEWNTFKLSCKGPRIRVAINGTEIIDVNVDEWDTAGKNPDGTKNKFKTALKDLPRTGRIGLQNHGQVVWFKDVVIRKL
jgi:hypothetical protein